ncbi:MAG: two-component system response regulator, partial [Candidatus Latescibacterota bacterium]
LRGETLQLDLTYAEFKPFSPLISNPGRVFTHQQIIEWLWEGEKVVSYKTMDVHAAHLRKKLGRYRDLARENRSG